MRTPAPHTVRLRPPLRAVGGAWALGLAVWLMASLAACGDGDDAGWDNNNTNQNNNNPWTDGGVECLYTITVDPMVPSAGELVSARVESSGSACAPNPQDGYRWTLTGPDQNPLTPTLRSAGRIAEFTPTLSGTYSIEVVVNDLYQGDVPLSRNVTVLDPAGMQQTYLLRLTPPLASNAPRQQQVMVMTGGTPVSDRVLTLDEGVAVTNTLAGPSGPIGGYLRFVQTGFSLYREVRVPASGQFAVAMLPNALYDVMVIPDDAEPAPYQLEGYSVPQLLASGAFQVDDGEAVVGYVVDDAHEGVGDAQAMLRSGELTSSVATCDSFDGRFVVWARPGPQSLEVAPPAGSGLPAVKVPESAGIELLQGGGLGLVVEYDAVSVVTLDLTVRAGAGGDPVPDARVTLEASSLGEVGTVTVTQDSSAVGTFGAEGRFRTTVVTDAQGRIPAVAVPAGRYRVLVETPQDAPAGYGTTVMAPLTVTAATALHLVLESPTELEGVVVDDLGIPVQDVRVIAVTQVGIGSAVQGVTDADGAFSLDVVAGASYSVLLVPPSGAQPLARRVLGPVVPEGIVYTLQGQGAEGGLILPSGLALSGRVVFQSDGLGGVLVQAIPSGTDGDPVLAETVTDLTGAFTLVVPDPGLVE